jgi:hypothetical protein
VILSAQVGGGGGVDRANRASVIGLRFVRLKCFVTISCAFAAKARDSGESPDKPLDATERAELERLRAENTELQMQVEFAKKVATWFAKDKR